MLSRRIESPGGMRGSPVEIRSEGSEGAGAASASRARVLAVANQKGGVGKTTTAVNLAASLAASERRTLLVDMDPQGNASSAFGIHDPELHIYQALVGECVMKDAVHPTELPQLSVVPAGPDLVGAEIELVSTDSRERRLEHALADLGALGDVHELDLGVVGVARAEHHAHRLEAAELGRFQVGDDEAAAAGHLGHVRVELA